ncbi:MAG: hypothetical protein MI919_04400 [Holophagales bacterium]|nr:hypothetical protein [Holophagales bacterium]
MRSTAAASATADLTTGKLTVSAEASPANDRNSSRAEAGWALRLRGERVWIGDGVPVQPPSDTFRVRVNLNWKRTFDLAGGGGENIAKVSAGAKASLVVDGKEVDSSTLVENRREADPPFRGDREGRSSLESGDIRHLEPVRFEVLLSSDVTAERQGEARGKAGLELGASVIA